VVKKSNLLMSALSCFFLIMYQQSTEGLSLPRLSLYGSQKVSGVLDSIKNYAQDTMVTIKDYAKNKIENVKDYAQDKVEAAKIALDKTTQNYANIMRGEPEVIFCPLDKTSGHYAPTIQDPEIRKADTENMIPLIESYCPIFYVCNEIYLPIAAEDYFTAPGTELIYQPGHKKNQLAPKQVIVSKGQVTMEKIYSRWSQGSYDEDVFFENDTCVQFGSNPKRFTDTEGNLTTPVYVLWTEYNNKLYITYVCIYGFNGPYTIDVPLLATAFLKGDILDFQNAHEFDLEHITLELNKDSRQMERIYFACHGSAEGVWLPAKHPDIAYEGTHPVAYVAFGGHGLYPRMGTHVRIYGFANDITCKGKRWLPQLVLLYPKNDPRFNAKTMGWVYHPGDYGRRGVDSLARKDWFYNMEAELRGGMSHDRVPFCPNPLNDSMTEKLQYRKCLELKRIDAKIPK
jgi:hypothetical protein